MTTDYGLLTSPMFIPHGEIIHESLATSYVLVDALVADLCEGGFSGVVEVLLRETDSFIVIVSGDVAAVVDKRADHAGIGATITYTRTTVAQLAERSSSERGRVSIYGYSAATASGVSGRINAKALYVGLSTEFTDLEKMISKLARERDREWFIEINAENVTGALIHMRDSACRIISATGQVDSGALDLPNNPSLGRLIFECNRVGGTFDVYFTQAAADTLEEQTPPEDIAVALPVEDARVSEESVESPLAGFQYVTSELLMSNESPVDATREPGRPPLLDPDGLSLERDEQIGVSGSAVAVAAEDQSSFASLEETATPRLTGGLIEPPEGDSSLVWDELPPESGDAEAMAEIKRLMAEIARAIEEAAQSVGRPDSFSMSLRAGQLRIADRYPFLDPFAGDFEYLSGEIVFVGRATAERFVSGLTEALELAIEAVTRSTAYADRFRSYITEDLQKLLARERAEFERFGLDEVIEQLMTENR